MKQKHPQRARIIVAAAIVFVFAIACGALFASHQKKPVSPESGDVKSMFSFTPPNGWRQGPSNETSMAAFSPSLVDGTSACFTSAEYYAGTVSVESALQKDADTITHGGNTVTALNPQMLAIQTPEGSKQYELRQYKVESSSSNPIMGGHSIGFVPLTDGYLKIYANCNAADELPDTLPALRAYTLNT